MGRRPKPWFKAASVPTSTIHRLERLGLRAKGTVIAMRVRIAEQEGVAPIIKSEVPTSLACIRKVIFGDPSKAGFYTILLFVPAHARIQSHSHRDNRIATVVSGEEQLGYGNHFDAKSLKTLSPRSVYSEPGGDNHFAQTDTEAVVVEISGYGLTDTRYFEAKNDPKAKARN
jgi:quercetin dioxygenase-like cupin family protein